MTHRMARLRRRKVSVGVVALAVAVAVPMLVIFNPLASSDATSSDQTAAPAGASEQLAAALGVLRQPATDANALPANLQTELGTLPGANGSLARRAFVDAQGTSVYLIPSTSGVCLLDSTRTQSTCFSTAEVLSGDATASADCSPFLPNGNTIEIAGVVPDGASDPVTILSNGTRVPLDVEGNAYLQQFSRSGPLPSQIQWDSPSGIVTSSAHVPTDVATEKCATQKEVEALVNSGKIPRPLGHPPAEPTQKIEYNQG